VALAFDALVSAGGGVRYRWVLRYACRDPPPGPAPVALAPPVTVQEPGEVGEGAGPAGRRTALVALA
jgi:hypothetical protein